MHAIDIDGDQLAALEEERAFVDLSSFRKILVSGNDAAPWLHDLVTADVEGLEVGSAARSLLLSPTGRIRADVQVARTSEGYLLLQDDAQQASIADLLSPYVLSSSVELTDVRGDRVLFAALGGAAGRVGWAATRPSVAGPGEDLVATRTGARDLEARVTEAALVEVSRAALSLWRIRLGIATFGVDFDAEALPSEAGLESAIDFTKGCFLGQESVAKVRNLGHPPRRLLHLEAEGRVEPGAAIVAADERIGAVTSAAPVAAGHGSALFGRVRWQAAYDDLRTEDGVPLTLAPPPH